MSYRALEFTTAIGCKNACTCCPQKELVHAYEGEKVMTLETFTRLLANTPTNVRLDWSGYCEPFQAPEASRMMLLAHVQGYSQVMYTTLVGATDEDIDRIANIPFGLLMVHLPDDLYFHKKEVSAIEAAWHRLAATHPEASTMALSNRTDSRLKVLERAHHISPYIMTRGRGTWTKPGPLHCSQAGHGFSQNVVLPNGDTYLCCCDYSLKHKLGNLLTTHYDQLDRASFYQLTRQHDSDILCRHCERAVSG